MKTRLINFTILCILFLYSIVWNQTVMIVVIDGARYTETFSADSSFIPHLWNQMRPLGTIWTNFHNDGVTKTNPAHASILTGTWQLVDNHGTSRPTQPTIFEYFRKFSGAPENDAAVIVGKNKLDILSHSIHTDYGAGYKACTSIGTDDTSVVRITKMTLRQNHPRLLLVNLASTDDAGHSGNWTEYLSALRTADSLVYDIWQTLQADSLYRNNTTLFVVNDHGRHDDLHGGFKNHGDDCEGCRHIMLLAIGRGFPADSVITIKYTQCDIAPTAGELLSFPTPFVTGNSLLPDTEAIRH